MEKLKTVKAKVAFFLGYNGCSFKGLQYQRDTDNTVQNVLHRVLCDQGFILQTNMGNLKRIKWSRAGRTDKKVHALCNGISCSLELDDRYLLSQEPRVIDFRKLQIDINSGLPPGVRILAAKKVGKGFDMRHDACSRIYNYIAPIHLFYPQRLFEDRGRLNQVEQHQLLGRVHQLAQLYLGTHSFHNFTKGFKPEDPRCDRFITRMEANLVERETIERALANTKGDREEKQDQALNFVRFTLVGQSFIYHQIRKMIGLLIKICHEELEGQQTIRRAFEEQKFEVYLAPGEGLYLNRMTFDLYNKKKEPHLRVELDEEDEKRIAQFRETIEGVILGHQLQEHLFTEWLAHHKEKPPEEEQDEEQEADP